MRERKILIAAILVVTVFAVSVTPAVRRWWKKDSGVMAEAEVKNEDILEPTKVVYDYANFDTEIKNHKTMTIDIREYGYSYVIHKNRDFELGTIENPFVVLEIVPHECCAEFGYLIPGSEPLGFDRPNVKYIGTRTDAAKLTIAFNGVSSSYIPNFPIWPEEKLGYAEYYGRPTSGNLEGEAYPEGYLTKLPANDDTAGHNANTLLGQVFGKFSPKSGGEYNISGTVSARDLCMSYVGTGNGTYTFEPIYSPSYDYVEKFGWDSTKGKIVPVYNESGKEISTAIIPSGAPHNWGKTYAYYDGKFGYFVRGESNGDFTKNLNLDNDSGNCTKITVVDAGNGSYHFVEESGTLSYFDLSREDGGIEFRREDEEIKEKKETIPVSYSISSDEEIFASINYYRPKEYYYHNEQKAFFVDTLGLSEAEIADYHIQVVTVTPKVLNALAEKKQWDLVDAADFISFNDTVHVGNVIDCWGKYYNEHIFSPVKEDVDSILSGVYNKDKWTFRENDISWAVAVRLLCKISIMQDNDFAYAPAIIPVGCWDFDTTSVSNIRHYKSTGHAYYGGGSGALNNVKKLSIMLLSFETEEDAYFYNNYIKKGKVVEKEIKVNGDDSHKVTTGYFKYMVDKNLEYIGPDGKCNNCKDIKVDELNQAALYWGDYTFLDYENIMENDGGHDLKELCRQSNLVLLRQEVSHVSVRNNVYIFNNDNPMTQQVGKETFEYKDDIYHKEPFELIEFCDFNKLTGYDVMYYLLHQDRSSLNVLINGSLKSKIYSNVDYEADNAQIALEIGQIVKKVESGQERLYGRVQFNVKLNTKRGDENDLSSALVQFNIYREDVFDNQTTMKLENLIPVTEAYRLTELEKEESEREKTRLKLGVDYYYDVPLELLEGTIVDGKLKAATTENVKFSAVVCYGLKNREQGIGNTEDDYKFKKNIYSYQFEQDENGKITKVEKDDRKTLTFVRRAMFNLD